LPAKKNGKIGWQKQRAKCWQNKLIFGKLDLKRLHCSTFYMKKVKYFNRAIKQNFTTAYYHYNDYKDRDTLIEQSPVINTLIKQSFAFLNSEKFKQNRKLSSKISKIGQKKRISGKKNRWKKKARSAHP